MKCRCIFISLYWITYICVCIFVIHYYLWNQVCWWNYLILEAIYYIRKSQLWTNFIVGSTLMRTNKNFRARFKALYMDQKWAKYQYDMKITAILGQQSSTIFMRAHVDVSGLCQCHFQQVLIEKPCWCAGANLVPEKFLFVDGNLTFNLLAEQTD